MIIAIGCDIGQEFSNKLIQRNRIDGLTPGQFLVSKLFRAFITYAGLLIIFLSAIFTAATNLNFQPEWSRVLFAALQMILSFLYIGPLVILLALLIRKTALILILGMLLSAIEYIFVKWANIPVPFLPVTLSETIFKRNGELTFLAGGNFLHLLLFFGLAGLYVFLGYYLLKIRYRWKAL